MVALVVVALLAAVSAKMELVGVRQDQFECTRKRPKLFPDWTAWVSFKLIM